MERKGNVILAALLGISLIISGCAAAAGAAAGAGTYAWTTGKLSFTTSDSISETHDATLEAFDDLEIKLVQDETDKLGGTLEGVTDTGEKITVDLEPMASDVTQVEIRVGFFGDRDKSTKIADAIKSHL